MNHYAVPALSKVSLQKSLQFISESPDKYLRRTLEQLDAFDLPAYYTIYSLNFNTGDYKLAVDNAYAKLFDKYYYGGISRKYIHLNIMKIHFAPSLFILLLLPAAFICAATKAWRIGTQAGFLRALMLCIYGWTIFMILFIDGAESARMRWHLEPFYLIMLFMALSGLAVRTGRRRNMRRRP